MEKIMTTDTSNTYYQNGRLRVITYNIIESLPEFQDRNVYVLLVDEDDPAVTVPHNRYGDIFIDMCNNIYLRSNSNIRSTKIKNTLWYMNSLGISAFNQSLADWIFVLLHELGHCVFYNVCDSSDEMNLIRRLEDNNISMMLTMFNLNRTEGEEVNIQEIYNLSQMELYADRYAFTYFPYIWNMLVSRGLV